MPTGTCEREAGIAAEAEAEGAIIESRLLGDLELIDEIQEFQFVWPDEIDAGIAARQAQLNANTYWVARTTHQLRGRQVVVASRETPEGQREAREVAAECLMRKAYSVHIWTVPGLGTQYPTMKQWATHYDLLTMLAFERGSKYGGFVSFVSNSQGEKPEFTGEPGPVVANLAIVPALEPSMLPESFRNWCMDIADRLWCPLEYVATPLVVVLSGVIGRRIAIHPKRRDDWRVVPNLWGAIVGPPGSLKSPAIEEVCRPLKMLDNEEAARFKEAASEHKREALVAAARRSASRKQMDKVAQSPKGVDMGKLRDLARDVAAEEDAPPMLRRHFLNDVTNEKLGELMAQEVNANGLIMFRDELVGFFKSLDRPGHESDRSFYLEAWNGLGSFTFDRIGRGTTHIPYACLALFGGIQPGPLSSYLRGSFSGEECDGFVQRFQLLMYPDAPMTYCNVDREPDEKARDRAVAIFRSLDTLEPAIRGCTFAKGSAIPYVRFDGEAQEFFDEWRVMLELRLRSGVLSDLMATHLSKYRSLMPSLALIFHLVECHDHPTIGEVPLKAAEMAAAWCDLLEKHAARIYTAAMEGDPDVAVRLSERLRDALPDPFTYRDVFRKQWSGLTTYEDIRRALALLEDRNWIKSVEAPLTERGGRPKELIWIHPKVRAQGGQES